MMCSLRREVSCLLVAETDPITGVLRRGPLMRVQNPPEGVRYIISRERLRYPKGAGFYSFSPSGIAVNSIRFFAEQLLLRNKSETQSVDLVHSITHLSWRSFDIPWIQENDQSFGQFLRDYVHIRGPVKRLAVKTFSANLNHRGCKKVIVWSEWAKRGYIEDGVEKSKIAVIPLPFSPVRDQRPHEHINILFVGRDYNRKGGEVAIRAFEKLKDFDVRLLYVGRIDDSNVLKRVKENEQITHFHHPSDSILYKEIFPISDLFILPTKAEAYAISVAEAMSRGMPVVASNISALPEMVEDGVSGYLCDPTDVISFAKACASLLENEKRRKRMGEEARKVIENRLSPQIIGDKLNALYSEVLS